MTLADEFAQALGYRDAKAMDTILRDRFERGDNRAGMSLRIGELILIALRLVERRLSTQP